MDIVTGVISPPMSVVMGLYLYNWSFHPSAARSKSRSNSCFALGATSGLRSIKLFQFWLTKNLCEGSKALANPIQKRINRSELQSQTILVEWMDGNG